MRHKVLIIDTSILCTFLRVKDLGTCGPENDRWDYLRVSAKIDEEIKSGTTLVLPLATLIEAGNHISHARGDKYKSAQDLHEVIIKAVNNDSPWAAFTEQSELWTAENLKKLSEQWSHELVVSGLSLADASIIDVAYYYHRSHFDVEILSGDKGLVAYQPDGMMNPRLIPRRRMK